MYRHGTVTQQQGYFTRTFNRNLRAEAVQRRSDLVFRNSCFLGTGIYRPKKLGPAAEIELPEKSLLMIIWLLLPPVEKWTMLKSCKRPNIKEYPKTSPLTDLIECSHLRLATTFTTDHIMPAKILPLRSNILLSHSTALLWYVIRNFLKEQKLSARALSGGETTVRVHQESTALARSSSALRQFL